jgi:hypothetical protein
VAARARVAQELWRTPGVAEALPPLGTIDGGDVSSHFAALTYFEMAAELGRKLWNGGAYSPTNGREQAMCLRLAASFLEDVGATERTALCLHSDFAWCRFFFDVAWDVTVVVIRPAAAQVTVLLATDTD